MLINSGTNHITLSYKDLNKSFNDFAIDKLSSKKLTKNEKKLLNFILNILHTYDINELMPASSMIAFMMGGCGLDYPQVLSSAINSFGGNHFCFTKMAEFMINNFTTHEDYYPGFGHPIFKDKDPRVEAILQKMKSLNIKSSTVDKCLNFSKQKKLILNIGGVSVAILLDLGFDKYTVNYFPIISRMLGITLIYKKIKQNKLRFATSLDNIDKYKNLFQHSSIDNAKLS